MVDTDASESSRRLKISQALKGKSKSAEHKLALSEKANSRIFAEIWTLRDGIPAVATPGHKVSNEFPYLRHNGQGKHKLIEASEFTALKYPGAKITHEIIIQLDKQEFLNYWYESYGSKHLINRVLKGDVLARRSTLPDAYVNIIIGVSGVGKTTLLKQLSAMGRLVFYSDYTGIENILQYVKQDIKLKPIVELNERKNREFINAVRKSNIAYKLYCIKADAAQVINQRLQRRLAHGFEPESYDLVSLGNSIDAKYRLTEEYGGVVLDFNAIKKCIMYEI